MHTYLNVDRYGDRRSVPSVRIGHPERELWNYHPADSCALDIVEAEGPLTCAQTARVLGVTTRSVELAQRSAIAKIRKTHPELADLLEARARESFSDVVDQGAWGESDGIEPASPMTPQERIEAWAERAMTAMRDGASLLEAWSAANESEDRVNEKSAAVETIHVFTCSVDPEHRTTISDDGRPDSVAYGIALRQTRKRFDGERCDAYVKGSRCEGKMRERTETEELG